MSYDLTISAGFRGIESVVEESEKLSKARSKGAGFAQLAKFIGSLPKVRPNGPTGFVLDDPPRRWMEIDLEGITGKGKKARVRWIVLHIPYAFLGEAAERDYFPVALTIARFLGWKVFDEQAGEEISRG
jgi:hypothetical protein